MKIKIRERMFETNSSSVHSICIPKNSHINENEIEKKYNKVFLRRNFYGWGPCVLDTFEKKINYIYEMCLAKDLEKNLLVLFDDNNSGNDKILGFNNNSYTLQLIFYLSDRGIEGIAYKGRIYDGEIDHDYKWENTIDEFLNHPEILDSILFDPKSYIYIDHDNHYDNYKALRPIDRTNYIYWFKYN